MPKQTPQSTSEQPKGLKDFSSLSFGAVSSIGFFVCVGIGYWADQKWQTNFRWTLVGVLFGISLVAYELWKIIRNLNDLSKLKK